MDETTLLRRLDSRTPEPTDAVLAAAYERLTERMDLAAAEGFRRRRSPRTRIVRRSALIGLGVAVATCAAVLAFTAGPAPTASAEVARTLQQAASALPASVVVPGVTRTHVLQLVSSWSGRKDASGELVGDGGLLVEWTTTLRETGDDGWVRDLSATTPLRAWGPLKAKLLEEAREDPDAGPSVQRSSTDPNFWTGPTSLSPAQVSTMPRDPEALLRRFSGVTNPDSALEPDTNRVIDAASALLGSGLADAELQAATYRALEHLPGLTVDKDGADIDGRHGVAIGALVSNGLQRIDLIIDPATGRFLGRTETNLTATDGAPAGNVEEGSAVYTQ